MIYELIHLFVPFSEHQFNYWLKAWIKSCTHYYLVIGYFLVNVIIIDNALSINQLPVIETGDATWKPVLTSTHTL